MAKKLSCGVLVVDDKNNILMQHVRGPDHWDIPKGGQKEGETPLKTSIRELAEETGLIAAEEDLIDIGVFDYNPYKDIYLHVMRVTNIDVRKLTVDKSKQYRDYGFVDEHRMIPWGESPKYMCQSLEYLFADRMRKEVEIVVSRFNAGSKGVEPRYLTNR